VQGAAARHPFLARLAFGLVVALAGCTAHIPPELPSAFHPPLAFALIGDTPYSESEVAALDRMIDEMNREGLAFVIHVGDITGGQGPCTDEWYEARKRQFDRFVASFIIVPGDNEWVDCHRSGRDPLERLAKFRDMFESGDASLGGRRLELERQSGPYAEYREHVRWIAGNVLFVGLNVQGSNNNLGRTPAMDAEYRARMAAVFAWMQDSLKLARESGVAGMLIFAQADPDFEHSIRRRRGDGFAAFRDALRDLAVAFGKPVLFVHGDTHQYKLDKPLLDPRTGRKLENFTRVCVFGSPQTRWIRSGVDAATPQLFEVSPQPSPGM